MEKREIVSVFLRQRDTMFMFVAICNDQTWWAMQVNDGNGKSIPINEWEWVQQNDIPPIPQPQGEDEIDKVAAAAFQEVCDELNLPNLNTQQESSSLLEWEETSSGHFSGSGYTVSFSTNHDWRAYGNGVKTKGYEFLDEAKAACQDHNSQNKRLVWKSLPDDDFCDLESGDYTIQEHSLGGASAYVEKGLVSYKELSYDSVEDAKAACQSHSDKEGANNG